MAGGRHFPPARETVASVVPRIVDQFFRRIEGFSRSTGASGGRACPQCPYPSEYRSTGGSKSPVDAGRSQPCESGEYRRVEAPRVYSRKRDTSYERRCERKRESEYSLVIASVAGENTRVPCRKYRGPRDTGRIASDRRRCSTSRDALEVRRFLPKNRPGISVTEAICVTKRNSAKLYFKAYEEASLSVDYRTSLEESKYF